MIHQHALKWILQRVTGALLLFFLTFHLWLNHYFDSESYFYRIFFENFSPSGWSILRSSFLILIIFHACNGLYTVLSSYIKRGAVLSLLAITIIVLALVLIEISWKFVF